MARYIDAEIVAAKMMYYGFRHNDMTVSEFIDSLPAADVEKLKHSEWLPSPDGINPIRCKRCNTPAPYVFVSNALGNTELIRYKFNYCPYCGAKMDGGENETC